VTVLAHAGHWLADALYVAPLFVVAALLVAGRRRERRRTRRRQVNGQTPGSGG
jgi:hypothetical protein